MKSIDLKINLRLNALSFEKRFDTIDPETWKLDEVKSRGSCLQSILDNARVSATTWRNDGPTYHMGATDPQNNYDVKESFDLGEIGECNEDLENEIRQLILGALVKQYFELLNQSAETPIDRDDVDFEAAAV